MIYSDLTLYLRYGDKGSGKSLLGAIDQVDLLASYSRNYEKYNKNSLVEKFPLRILYTSELFNKEIEEVYLGKTLFYWKDPKTLRYCPRTNCWKVGKHACHDMDIYWGEVGRHFGADRSSDTPYWLKDLLAFCRKDGNRIFFDTQVYEDLSIAFRRQLGHTFFCVKDFGSKDISADRPAPIQWTLKNLFNLRERVVWGRISEYEFDPKFLEWERNPEARMRLQEEANENRKVRWEYITWRSVNLYDTRHRIAPYGLTLEHSETYCENDNCEKHGRNFGNPKIEHFRI